MTVKQHQEQSQESKPDVRDLWSALNIYDCNYWFLGVDQATEVTESFREQDRHNVDESFAAEIKVPQHVTSQRFILKLRSEPPFLSVDEVLLFPR